MGDLLRKTVQQSNNNSFYLISLIAVVAVSVMGFLMWTNTYNTLVQKEESVKHSWGNVEAAYERRLDLIPNFAATVKGYADFEQSIWIEFAKARRHYSESTDVQGKVEAANQIDILYGRFLGYVEAYPELKANENFMALQAELAATENQIISGRQSYNDKVNDYQSYKRQFLTSLIAGNSFKDYPYFKSRDGANVAPIVDFE